jgi:ABC-type nickel/cobalt efflux system permease component RcnA
MNPIPLLTTAINDLWFWTYGLVAGWGVTVTLLIATGIFLTVKVLKLSQRVARLEARLVHAERDYNITIAKWKN